MKKEFIDELFAKFENACYIYEGIECWSARDLQDVLGYAQWRNFVNAVDKAKQACEGRAKRSPTILLISAKW